MKRRKWNILLENYDDIQISMDKIITNLAKKVLFARGYNSSLKIKEFISSKYSDLYDPFLMKDMQLAVDIIKNAIENKKNIVIYGDYDVDGVTSTVILTDYLLRCGAKASFYIPNRDEGYGLNNQAIDDLKSQNTNLIITVDCGITAVEEIEYAKENGIDVIITDHHSVKETIPKADAIINPKQKGCNYPFKNLAGVGVCFKLLCALDGDYHKILNNYADMVAIGTIADVMPLVLENRVIVNVGVDKISKTENVGLYHLTKDMNEITSISISYKVAPRINAAGRMEHAKTAVDLLLTNDEHMAKNTAFLLLTKNKERQDEEAYILQQTLEKIDKEVDFCQDKIIIICGENWHHGVVGIVSSRIIEKYNLPVIILSNDGETIKGSARSVKGFNIFDALVTQDNLLLKYGGHELAAGMTISASNFEQFKQNIKEYARKTIKPEMLLPILTIDAKIDFQEITQQEVLGLSELEPYGAANLQPVFCTENVVINSISSFSDGKHLKINFEQNGKLIEGLLFSTPKLPFKQNDIVSIAYTLSINDFRNNKRVQLILKDITFCQSEINRMKKDIDIYQKFIKNREITISEKQKLIPTRMECITVWKNIQDIKNFNLFQCAKELDIPASKMFIILDIFTEGKLLNYTYENEVIYINKNDSSRKFSIEDTKTFKQLLC